MIRRYKHLIAYSFFCILFTVGLLIVVHFVNEINSNRRTSQANTCAIIKGITNAGRDQILLGTLKPPPYSQEKQLQNLGFPPYKVRKQEAIDQANQYIKTIADTVKDETGKTGVAIKNNTVDCTKLKKIAGLDK